jgi:hypothetical protein
MSPGTISAMRGEGYAPARRGGGPGPGTRLHRRGARR